MINFFTYKASTGRVDVRLETGLNTLDVHPGLDTAVAVHPLYAAVQPVDLLTDGLHQSDHDPRDKLLADPADLGVNTDHVVEDFLHVVPSPGRSDALGPVELPGVHVGLDDGDDGLTLQLIVGVEQLLVQDAVHVDTLRHGLVQAQLLQVGEFGEDVGENFGLGVLAVVETVEKSPGVWRDVSLTAETFIKLNQHSPFCNPVLHL